RLPTSQINAITLGSLVQPSLTRYHKISPHDADLADAVDCSQIQTCQKLGLQRNHIHRLTDLQRSASQTHFQHSLEQIQLHSDFVLLHTDAEYPQQLSHYEHKPPILFGQGHADQLLQPQIAIVGSRKPSPHGQQVAYDFAFYLSEQG